MLQGVCMSMENIFKYTIFIDNGLICSELGS